MAEIAFTLKNLYRKCRFCQLEGVRVVGDFRLVRWRGLGWNANAYFEGGVLGRDNQRGGAATVSMSIMTAGTKVLVKDCLRCARSAATRGGTTMSDQVA
jgi:hypothetical protein